ncbi:hypothetical protein PPC_4302 [Pseudomonas protegens Cab57]|nr:hypothetical protein PPC_4302 [Pseudomonas protegens Cab57]
MPLTVSVYAPHNTTEDTVGRVYTLSHIGLQSQEMEGSGTSVPWASRAPEHRAKCAGERVFPHAQRVEQQVPVTLLVGFME